MNLKKYINLLSEPYSLIYGEEHREIIRKRTENVYINFGSSPLILEQYLNKFPNRISFEMKEDIKEKLREYNKAKELWYPWCEFKFKKFLTSIIDSSNQMPLTIFTNSNFSSGLIDVFSSETEKLLESKFAIPELKQSILNDREQLLDSLKKSGVDISFLKAETIDSIIDFRYQIQLKYKSLIVQYTKEGKTLIDDFKEKYNYELTDWDISEIFYRNEALSYSIPDIDVDVITVPYALLQLIESKNIDETLIHELHHTAEKHYGNNIASEIRIEKQALKIAKEFANKKIFLFDNPNDYQEFDSFYTLLFPVTFDFFEKYSNILNDCAIKNNNDLLPFYFGPNWTFFVEQLQELSDCLAACIKKGILDKMDINKYKDYFRYIIDDMDKYFMNHNLDEKMDKIGYNF